MNDHSQFCERILFDALKNQIIDSIDICKHLNPKSFPLILFSIKNDSFLTMMKLQLSVYGTNTNYTVYANQMQTIEELMNANSIFPEDGFKFLILFNGKTINSFLSLGALGIKDGSKVILFQKRLPQPIQIVCGLTEEEREEVIEEKVIEERCRIADLGFNGWECDPKAPAVLKDLYDAEQEILAEEDEENHNFELFMHGTVVSKITEICDKPLPRCFLCSD